MRYYECAECGRVYAALDKYHIFKDKEWNPGVDLDDFEDPQDEETCVIQECPDCFDPEDYVICENCGARIPISDSVPAEPGTFKPLEPDELQLYDGEEARICLDCADRF